MNRLSRRLLLVSIVFAVGGAIATLKVYGHAEAKFDLRWGGEARPIAMAPYLLLLVVGVSSHRRMVTALVAMIGTLAITFVGVYAYVTVPDAIGFAMIPYLQLSGCGILIALQLALWFFIRRSISLREKVEVNSNTNPRGEGAADGLPARDPERQRQAGRSAGSGLLGRR